MDTKTCSKCGWVLAIKDPNSRCPVCGTKFDIGICRVCGQLVEYYRKDRNVCRHCYDTVIRKPDAMPNVRQRRREVYQEWLDKIKLIPKNYPTLTEEQWLKTVRHFNGCAMCGSEEVDTRQYFIPFKNGGRYCDWNVIPVCTNCAIKNNRYTEFNYFLKEPRPVGLTKTIEYLEEKINEALRKSTGKTE